MPVRWLPFSSRVAVHPLPETPEERIVELGRRVADWVESWHGRMLFFADWHGIVTGPQILDRVASAIVKATQRPAVRLLLFGGVFIVGFLGALVPEKQVAALVGDNSLVSNFVASVVGCAFYFATLTEIPILEALMKNGMASGPALALLLAGPALSIPSILVIRSVIGNQKTAVFVALVVVMATIAGMGYGAMYPDSSVIQAPHSTVALSSAIGG